MLPFIFVTPSACEERQGEPRQVGGVTLSSALPASPHPLILLLFLSATTPSWPAPSCVVAKSAHYIYPRLPHCHSPFSPSLLYSFSPKSAAGQPNSSSTALPLFPHIHHYSPSPRLSLVIVGQLSVSRSTPSIGSPATASCCRPRLPSSSGRPDKESGSRLRRAHTRPLQAQSG